VSVTLAVNSEPRRGKSGLSVEVRLSEMLRLRLLAGVMVMKVMGLFTEISQVIQEKKRYG